MVSSIHVLSKTTTLFHAGKVDKKAKAQPGTCGKGGQFDAWMEDIEYGSKRNGKAIEKESNHV